MAKHEIYIKTKGAQTTSVYKVKENDDVVFHNLGTATLTVTFDDAEGPLCDTGNKHQKTITVTAAQKKSKDLKVCKGENINGYPYTAQIEGSAAEDPIVIIEKTKGFPSIDAVSLTIGIIAGLLAGFILARLLIGGKTRTPA